MKSTIRLFRALPVSEKQERNPTQEILAETLKRGFVFSPEVFYNYDDSRLRDLIRVIEKEIGLTPEQMNRTFHKSWKKVSEASIEKLILEQMIHYFTTYGFEQLGIYSKDSVYIPQEDLEIPGLRDGIPIVVIKGYTKDELREKLIALLGSGLALSEDTIGDVVDLSLFVEIKEADLEKVKNKEVRIQLYDYLDILSENPTEFLRYLVYKTTGSTLLIKNKETVDAIKEHAEQPVLVGMFKKYEQRYGYKRLAEIFYRFKPLFLALKENQSLKPVINKLRKLANTYHKPMKEDFLNTVTAKVGSGKIDRKILDGFLKNANTFRKIRLAYALKYRTMNVDSILYRIRNGKAYAKDFTFKKPELARDIFSWVLKSISRDIEGNIKKKKIYIPDFMCYTLPATEKQFTGNFPTGTSVVIPKDMVFGINWHNKGSHRIDLDLSLVGLDGKFGWDANYLSKDRGILFSGDITDAGGKNGATELFYTKKQTPASYVMFVNYYNYDAAIEVPFKILVAHEAPQNLKQNYMVDPNNVLAIANTKINKKQMILGLLVLTEEECRFYFSEAAIGNRITSRNNVVAEQTRKYLLNYYTNGIDFKEILTAAGGELVDEKENCDLDLSPEALEKDSILSLLI
jgi:hypothetical protein